MDTNDLIDILMPDKKITVPWVQVTHEKDIPHNLLLLCKVSSGSYFVGMVDGKDIRNKNVLLSKKAIMAYLILEENGVTNKV